MALTGGSRLGAYEILAPLGAGGMGEVYRARDTRLDRTVAIKVLPEALAADPQFRDRFDREARTISQLTHPHICTLYDVGEDHGTAYLVMEYLEGETLAERISREGGPKGPPLRLDDAIAIATQIAGALDAAHRAGVVHRDLKPGNIMLVRRGGPSGPPDAKLLDFGLAKTSAPAVAASGLSIAPTGATPLTAQGTILGTFQYMAPEQLEGKEADARTDIFAFGALLYEMLTGSKAFDGATQASVIGAIMHADPPAPSTLVPLTPPIVDRIVRKCLAKDPDERWQSARDLLEALNWISADASAATTLRSAQPLRSTSRRLWLITAAAALVIGFLASASTLLYVRSTAPPRFVTRLDVVTPPSNDPASFAVSPDGRQLAFVAAGEGFQRLWVRSLDQATAQPVPGTEGALYPFWAPDGRAIGFFADAKLKIAELSGGGVRALSNAPSAKGGTWNRDDVILFAPSTTGGLSRIAAAGGAPSVVTKIATGQSSHRFPEFLPDGRHFLFLSALGRPDTSGIYFGDLAGSEPNRLLESDSSAAYGPPGYLVLISQGVLVARRFDADRAEIVGEPIAIADGVRLGAVIGQPSFSVASTGVLAYRTGATARRQLIWVDRTGKALGALAPADEAASAAPHIAHDGNQVALNRTVQGNVDVWLLDTKRATSTRFTFDPSVDAGPLWSPDGTRLVWRSSRTGDTSAGQSLFEKPSDGSRDEQPLLVSPADKSPLDWSPDGRFLLFAEQGATTNSDIWAMPISGDRKPFVVVQSQFDDIQGQFSPDGHWIAYVSNETGRYEIYVRPFPGPGGKWQMSAGGGIYPKWRRDGQELFYIAPDNRMMAVLIHAAATVSPGTPVPLFPTQLATGGNVGIGGFSSRAEYDVTTDGRFLLNVNVDAAAASPITVMLNWDAALKPR